jgi:hypothetical protein
MAEPSSSDNERALELEERRGPPETPGDLAPLPLERWAIVLRRSPVQYEGYARTSLDPEGLALVERKRAAPDTNLMDALKGRLSSLGRWMFRGRRRSD